MASVSGSGASGNVPSGGAASSAASSSVSSASSIGVEMEALEKICVNIENVIESMWRAEVFLEKIPTQATSASATNDNSGSALYTHMQSMMDALNKLDRAAQKSEVMVPKAVLDAVNEGRSPATVASSWLQTAQQRNDRLRGRVVHTSILSQLLRQRVNEWDKATEDDRQASEERLQKEIQKRQDTSNQNANQNEDENDDGNGNGNENENENDDQMKVDKPNANANKKNKASRTSSQTTSASSSYESKSNGDTMNIESDGTGDIWE